MTFETAIDLLKMLGRVFCYDDPAPFNFSPVSFFSSWDGYCQCCPAFRTGEYSYSLIDINGQTFHIACSDKAQLQNWLLKPNKESYEKTVRLLHEALSNGKTISVGCIEVAAKDVPEFMISYDLCV